MNIKTRFNHYNFNVLDLDMSIAFYEKALNLKEVRRKEVEDGSFILVYLGDGESDFTLELTWIKGRTQPYNLGECEFHLCMTVDGDYSETREFHREMGCIAYENTEMGLYFISDPDGYWIEMLEPKTV